LWKVAEPLLANQYCFYRFLLVFCYPGKNTFCHGKMPTLPILTILFAFICMLISLVLFWCTWNLLWTYC